MKHKFKAYGIEYGYGRNGERWTLSILATSPEDAMARLKRAASFGHCYTPYGIEEVIPANSVRGIFVPSLVWLRNRRRQMQITIHKLIINIFGHGRDHGRKHAAVSAQMMFAPIGEEMAKATVRTDDPGKRAVVVYKDKKGVPGAKVYGTPEWSQTDDSIASLEVADDGMSALVLPLAVGTTTITVKAEGEPNPGDQVLLTTGDYEVVPSDAESSELSFQDP